MGWSYEAPRSYGADQVPSSVFGPVGVKERPRAAGLIRPGGEGGEDRRAGRGERHLGIAPARLLLLRESDVLPLNTAVEADVGLGGGPAVGTGESDGAGQQVAWIAGVRGRHDLDVRPVAIAADEVVGTHHDSGLLAGVGRARCHHGYGKKARERVHDGSGHVRTVTRCGTYAGRAAGFAGHADLRTDHVRIRVRAAVQHQGARTPSSRRPRQWSG